MDESDLEPDPRRRVPTMLWLMLGLALVVLFAVAIVVLVGHAPQRAVGPPPGVP